MLKSFFLFITLTGMVFVAQSQSITVCESDARQLIFSGDYSGALDRISSPDCSGVDSDKLTELKVQALYLSGNLSGAAEAASMVVDSLSSRNLLALKARIYKASGRYEAAAGYYSLLTQTDSCNAAYFSNLADCYSNASNYNAALVNAKRSFELNCNNSTNALLYASLLNILDHPAEADSILNIAITLDPIPSLMKLRGDVNYEMKEFEIAWQCYKPVLDEGTFDKVLIRKAGVCKYMIGDTEESISILSLAYDLNPEDELCCYYLASAYQSVGEFDKAELFYNAAINNGYSDNLALYYYRSGVNYEQRGEYNKALTAYKNAWQFRDEERDGNEDLLFEIARVYQVYLRDDDNALLAYKKFMTHSSDTTSGNYRAAKRRVVELEGDTLNSKE